MRGVFEHLGFDVTWNNAIRTAAFISAEHEVIITIGSYAFIANGASYILDAPAQIINGYTMLPIRAVLESVGYFVGWNADTRTVLISGEPIGEYVQPSVTVEFVSVDYSRSITLLVTNHTDYSTALFDEIEIGIRTPTGDWEGSGIQTEPCLLHIQSGTVQEFRIDNVPFEYFLGKFSVLRLPMNASENIDFWEQMGDFNERIRYGVYRLSMKVSVGDDKHNLTQTFDIDVQFQVDDPDIPSDKEGVFMFAMAYPGSLFIGVKNLFNNGNLYFDRFFQLQRYADGQWHDVPQWGVLTYLNNVMFSLYPGQSGFMSGYASDYLQNPLYEQYGELEAGIYRLTKVFWHYKGNGQFIPYEIYTRFTLEFPPLTTRRVIEKRDGLMGAYPIPGSNDSIAAQRHHSSHGLETVFVNEAGGNTYATVLNADGVPISINEIPVGAVVDIVYNGMAGWGSLLGVHLIQIVSIPEQ